MIDTPAAGTEALERARNLFRFLKAFAERNVPVHRTLSQHAWTLALRELPAHPAVALGEVLVADPGADAPDEAPPPLLRVSRPKLTRAPEPPPILREHLQPGWDRADGTIQVRPARNVVRTGETVTERFEGDPARVEALEAWRARWNAWAHAERRAESPFEVAVIQRLLAAGFRVQPQVRVGRYRIDLVVSDGVHQAALECDGDRYHGPDQIPADMALQAVLERTGWRFIRVRGTRFYRDPDATMAWVFGELRRLDVAPAGPGTSPSSGDAGTPLREAVVRRAWEIMREQCWITLPDGG